MCECLYDTFSSNEGQGYVNTDQATTLSIQDASSQAIVALSICNEEHWGGILSARCSRTQSAELSRVCKKRDRDKKR